MFSFHIVLLITVDAIGCIHWIDTNDWPGKIQVKSEINTLSAQLTVHRNQGMT